MSLSHSILVIPHFVEDKSKRRLMRKMLVIQRKFSAKIHFYDIQFAEGKWVAWYDLSVTQGKGE